MIAVNSGIDISDTTELYGFGTCSRKKQTGGFFYRRAGISTFLPLRLEDGSIYDPRHLYPAGFTPQFTGDVRDAATIVGLKGQFAREWTYDLSGSYGRSEIRYHLANSMNPSLGPDTPAIFRLGNLVNGEVALNGDLAREVEVGAASPLHLAIGFEYRTESYQIEAGDPASYVVGPFGVADPFNFEITRQEVDPDPNDEFVEIACRIPGFETTGSLCPTGDPVNNAAPIGFNGFAGYSPKFASDYSRRNLAGYVDLEIDFTEKLLANAAFRFENFEDFGDVLIWKLAYRYRLVPNTNLRDSLGTGFRAPTSGQLSTTNVNTRIGAGGLPMSVGIFPATHEASQLFDSKPLEPEHSESITLGFTSSLTPNFEVAIDYYDIQLIDRILLSSSFAVGPDDTARLVELGVPAAVEIGLVSFFTNDVDTKTQGVDIVGLWSITSSWGITQLQANLNFNSTEITRRGTFIEDEGEHDIENGVPASRMSYILDRSWRNYDFSLRVRRYGEYRNVSDASLSNVQVFDAEYMLDVGFTYNIEQKFKFKLGAENILDVYPGPENSKHFAGEFIAVTPLFRGKEHCSTHSFQLRINE